jgi:hypothetical protein
MVLSSNTWVCLKLVCPVSGLHVLSALMRAALTGEPRPVDTYGPVDISSFDTVEMGVVIFTLLHCF